MALKWILRDGIVTSVLIGASRPQQILENLKVLDSASFSEEELKKIERKFIGIIINIRLTEYLLK